MKKEFEKAVENENKWIDWVIMHVTNRLNYFEKDRIVAYLLNNKELKGIFLKEIKK